MLYIAYGSNLSKAQMRRRCPNARPVGKFMLTEARLVFRGVADLEHEQDAQTPCGLWNVSDADERALDRYEGISSGVYFKSKEIMLDFQGKKRHALIYLMNSNAIYPPSRTYVETIRRGYKDFGLDQSYLDKAIAASFDKVVDDTVLERRERQLLDPDHFELVENPNADRLQLPSNDPVSS